MRGHWMRWTIGGLAAVFLAAAPARAQEAEGSDRHVVDRGEAWEAMARKADRAEEQRAIVRALLDRPGVERVAGEHGLDLTRARDAISTLEGAELRQVARRAAQVDAALAGGDDTIVISTTTLIIALLVLIIILVA